MASAARRLGAVFNLVFVATSLLHVIYAEVEPRRRSFATVSRSNFVPLTLARHRRESSSSGGTPSTGSEDATAEATETTIINAVIPWDDDAGGDLTVQVTFGDEKPFRRLVYGDFDRRRMIFRNDSFVVTVGQVSYRRHVSEYFRRLPRSAKIVLFVTRSLKPVEGAFKEQFFELPMKAEPNSFYLYTFNGLGTRQPNQSLDVVAFNPEAYEQKEDSLYLIADDVRASDARYSLLNSSDFEIKVFHKHDVTYIGDYKNMKPVTDPLYGHCESGQVYFGILTGDLERLDKYPIHYKVIPALQKPKRPLPRPVTDVYVLNAYPEMGELSVSFATYDFQPVAYGSATRGRLYLKKGDPFEIAIDDETELESVVGVDVPYSNGMCVIVPDSGKFGNLEVFVHCWEVDMFHWNKSEQAWVFTYNTAKNCSVLDFLLLGAMSRQLCKDNCTRFYAVASALDSGNAMYGPIDAGTYDLKVVAEGTVEDSIEYRRTNNALIAEPTLIAAPGIFYFSVLSGECDSDEFPARFFAFPSFGRTNFPDNVIIGEDDEESAEPPVSTDNSLQSTPTSASRRHVASAVVWIVVLRTFFASVA
ncbi:uncharacterized protein [Oscarella lobularis]|uniref:uncharacterized protein n=1 Tax=Oscarella lobularis TaxID=121494 RepID=UPI0033131132